MELRLRARDEASFAIPPGWFLKASFGSSPRIPNGADSLDGSLENMAGCTHEMRAVGVTGVGVTARDCSSPRVVFFFSTVGTDRTDPRPKAVTTISFGPISRSPLPPHCLVVCAVLFALVFRSQRPPSSTRVPPFSGSHRRKIRVQPSSLAFSCTCYSPPTLLRPSQCPLTPP